MLSSEFNKECTTFVLKEMARATNDAEFYEKVSLNKYNLIGDALIQQQQKQKNSHYIDLGSCLRQWAKR